MQELTDKEARELWALLHLREALGDPTGKLMQDELVERARQAWKDAERYRWLKTQVRVMSLNMSGNHVWVQASSGALRGPDMDAACDAGMALRHNVKVTGLAPAKEVNHE